MKNTMNRKEWIFESEIFEEVLIYRIAVYYTQHFEK